MAINYATQIRRELIARVTKMLLNKNIEEKIDRVAVEMRPRDRQTIRCCVHKERAVLKYKIMALLGFNIHDEIDELTTLSEYASIAKKRTEYTPIMLTVVDEACSSCVKNNYIVTNLCRGCVARPCLYACNKNAINITDKASIDSEKCVNCGQCMNVCPFHAIIYQPIPCEESCPVGAIKRNEKGVEYIDDEKCIYCGKCMVSCPFGAIMEKSFLLEIIERIQSGKRVVAMVAPALLGQFKVEFGRMVTALKKIGFTDVIEVALGANVTTKNETEEFIERMHEGAPFMTTSCCPAWMHVVNKHIPEIKPFVSTTLSPMAYTAQIVRERYPDATAVFISPCVGKRSEGHFDPNVNFVLSFEELGAWFMAAGVEVMECEEASLDTSINKDGHGFAFINGVTQSVLNSVEKPEQIKSILIDGIDKAAIRTLKSYAKGNCPGNFVEVMSCQGGCVNGCDTINNPRLATKQIQTFIQEKP